MTVVVTGAAGHAGANLVRALITQHRPTRALVHVHQQAIEGLEVEVAEGDVCDLESLVEAFNGADVVYHLAARISITMDDWPHLEMVNIIGTRNVVEACLRCGVRRLVHFSSIHSMIQEPMTIPVDESRLLVGSQHCLPYDRSKAAGEKEVRKGIEMGLDAIIISPTAIIGPHDYQLSHFGQALLALANGRLPALVAGGFDWVDVRDIIEGAMRAEERASTGAKYILSGHWLSLRDLADQLEEITGIPTPGFVCPMWLAHISAPIITAFDRVAGRRPLYTSASMKALHSNRNISHERATRELDYHPRPFRETLIDTLRWFEETGQLARPLKPRSTGTL
jgi:dihydroflavonol-4-reductase